jgi:hypothetical protein
MGARYAKQTRNPFARACLWALVLQALCVAPARSQVPRPQIDPEHEKQESIYRSQGAAIPGGYITGRGLEKYVELLPAGFVKALNALGPEDRWLDIGAGSGKAILDYYAQEITGADGQGRRGKASAVALSIEDRRTESWQQRTATLGPDRIRYVFGKRLRDYGSELGRFKMITDVYGGFSYTDQLSVFIDKVLAILEVNGSFYSLLQSVKLEDGSDDPQTWYLTEIVDAAGADVKVCSWLKRITCVEVSCDSRGEWEAPTELIQIRKTCDHVQVPALVRLQYEAGTPPGRRFRLDQ